MNFTLASEMYETVLINRLQSYLSGTYCNFCDLIATLYSKTLACCNFLNSFLP